MEGMSFQEFKQQTCHARKGKFKVTGSFGVYDCYKWIRKNDWCDIGRPVTEKEFYAIVRGVNKLLAEKMLQGKTVYFPEKMGILELRKIKTGIKIVDNKLKFSYLPLDWNSTLKLWYEDEEARKNKVLLRYDNEFTYFIKYKIFEATYNNKNFYKFAINQKLRKKIYNNVKQGLIDTLW